MSAESLAAEMRQHAAQAVGTARNYAVMLDYSVQSLAAVDVLLLKVHEAFRQLALTNAPHRFSFCSRMVSEFCGYTGEVLVLHCQGQWREDRRNISIRVGGRDIPIFNILRTSVASGTPSVVSMYSEITGRGGQAAAAWASPVAAVQTAVQAAPRQPQAEVQPVVPTPSPALPANITPSANSSAALSKLMAESAVMAIRDVKAMLKKDLDFSPASLEIVQEALVRLRGMVTEAPEHADAILAASLKKYGPYVGEVVARALGGVWCVNVQGLAEDIPALYLGTIYAVPQQIVRAVLVGQALELGPGEGTASTVPEFFECCRRARSEQPSASQP